MYKTLCALKVKKSPGPELVPNVVWKEFAFELSPVLPHIYNSSLEQGYVPAQLKQAIVVPVPKSHPPASVESDLRPVSLTSPVAKVLEGFSAKSLLMCVWDKLDSKQFALRRPWFIYFTQFCNCLLYTSPSPRDLSTSRMPSSA